MKLQELSNEDLIAKLKACEKLIDDAKTEKNEYEAILQKRGYYEIENKGRKTVQYFGDKGNIVITKAAKITVEDYSLLEQLFGEQVSKYVKCEKTEKLTPLKALKDIAEAFSFNEYLEVDLQELLKEYDIEPDSMMILTKKLKGVYDKDKELLQANTDLSGDKLEELIFFVHEVKNYEKIRKVLDKQNNNSVMNVAKELSTMLNQKDIDETVLQAIMEVARNKALTLEGLKELINNAVMVEEQIKITANYEKEE
ncbi:hypothetical protein [Vallitalea guaymasensis]|uniref:hypothetical protein n=1 Tax=Vallitalea guaymasensis TaxID=1185412 RepID=UPI000DE46296|nr:hypothetical protein [Vallitalea guaymasensis]